MKLLSSLAILWLVFAARPLLAVEPDEAYLPIYSQIEEAESLEASGQNAKALAQYKQVFADLKAFQKRHPDWNAKVVNQRLNRVTEKITALSQKPAVAPQTSTNAAGAAASSPKADGSVKLLQPGAEPRKALRLHPKAGDKQTVEMTLSLSMATKMGAAEMPMKMPPMKLALSATVKDVSPTGDIRYELLVDEAGIAEGAEGGEAMVAMTKTLIAGAKGATVTCTVSDRGVNKSKNVKLPPGADAQSGQIVDNMEGTVVILPEEPVGPGAKWEVRKVSKAQGFPVTAVGTFELVAIEGDRLTLKSATTENASNQKIQNPAMPGAKLDLVKYAGTGTGDLTADLGQLLPVEAKAKHHVESTAALGSGAQKQTIVQKIDLDVRLQTK